MAIANGDTNAEMSPERLLSSLYKWNDIIDLEVTTEYLLEGIIPKGSITMIYAPGGMGKSSLLLQIGYAIAEGKSFGNLSTIKTPVYYVDFENPLSFLKERVSYIGFSENIFVWHLSNDPPPPKLDNDNWEMYKSLPPGLIIFDTLRAAHALNENESKDMSLIMSNFKELRERGFTVVFLAHTPKENEQTYKGSTALLDLADHVVSLERTKRRTKLTEFDTNGDYRLGTRMKTRYEPYEVFLKFKKEKKGFEMIEDENFKNTRVVIEILKNQGNPINQGELKRKIKKRLNISENETRKLLSDGDGKYWQVTKGKAKNASLYSVMEFVDPKGYQQTNQQNLDRKTDPANSRINTRQNKLKK